MAEEGVRGVPESPTGGCTTVSLDELVGGDREAHLRRAARLPRDRRRARRCASTSTREMSAEAAHRERWREGLDAASRPTSHASYERRPRRASSARASTALRCCGGRTSASPRERGLRRGPRESRGREIVFVGGTGRSGTHVLARLLGRAAQSGRRRRSRRASTATSGGCPICWRAASRLDTATSPKLRELLVAPRAGRLGQPRGLYNLMTRSDFDAAARALRGRLSTATRSRPAAALFTDLLWPVADAAGKAGTGRDELAQHPRGADAAAPVPGRPVRPHGPRRPRLRLVGHDQDVGPRPDRARAIDWWAERLRAIDDGVRGERGRRRLRARRRPPADGGARRSRRRRPRGRLRPAPVVPRCRRRSGDARLLRRPDEPRGRAPGRWQAGPRPVGRAGCGARYERTLEALAARATTPPLDALERGAYDARVGLSGSCS